MLITVTLNPSDQQQQMSHQYIHVPKLIFPKMYIIIKALEKLNKLSYTLFHI
jgi:hypothetical protein